MFVSEIFHSLQGECFGQGAPTVFVRFAGCNLSCEFCDTFFSQSQADGIEMSPSTIISKVREHDTRPTRVCLTGGEPLLQPRSELEELITHLVRGDSLITVETNGACAVDWLLTLKWLKNIQLAVDYKLESSGMSEKMIRVNYTRLRACDVIKFVCGTPEDALQAEEVLRSLVRVHGCNATVFFHAVGGLPAQWLADEVLRLNLSFQHRFDIRFGVQLHKLIYGNERGR